MDKGDVDLALVPEPWGSRMLKEVDANMIFDYKDVLRDGNYATAVVIVRTEFLKEHSDIVKKFIKAHVELTDYINSNSNEAKDIVNVQIKELTQKALDKDILDEAFKRIIVTINPEEESVQDFAKLSVETGFLRNEPNIKDLFNIDILNKILRENGKAEIR